MKKQIKSKLGSSFGLPRLTRWLRQGLRWAALTLALAVALPAAVRAQTGPLGAAFPLYVTNLNNTIVRHQD
jgi:hypothetical protein